MFAFLRRLFQPTPPPEPDWEGPFAVTLRDGTRRHYDPLELRQKLKKALPDWQEQARDVANGAKPLPRGTSAALAKAREDRLDAAVTALADAVSEAFALPPLAPDGTGHTRGERILVLAEYIVWSGEAVEDARPLGFGGEPTGSVASAP